MKKNNRADPGEGKLLGRCAVSKGAALSSASHGALSPLASGSSLAFAVIAQWGPRQMLMLKSPGRRSCPRLRDGDFGRPLLATGRRIFLIEQMNCWDAQNPLRLSRQLWRMQGMVLVTQEGCPVLRPAGLPPSIISQDTNSCSLLPCSSMHHCRACRGTTTPPLRRPGKAKATRGRMRNSIVWDVQLQIHVLHSESVLDLMQSGPAAAQGVGNA